MYPKYTPFVVSNVHKYTSTNVNVCVCKIAFTRIYAKTLNLFCLVRRSSLKKTRGEQLIHFKLTHTMIAKIIYVLKKY